MGNFEITQLKTKYHVRTTQSLNKCKENNKRARAFFIYTKVNSLG